jgi:hypothetical protein
MFKVGNVVGITSAQSLVQDTQKVVNKKGTTNHNERKKYLNPVGNRLGWVWWDAKFDSTQFKKKYLNPSSYTKVMTVLPKHVQVTVLEGGI